MSNSNLLSTKTVNFMDLLGNGRSYEVPPYQRDYSWTEEQWEDLWLDICEQRPDVNNRHYLGTIVVQEKTDREKLIIDGQQRITTLVILALAVIKRLEDLANGDSSHPNAERARSLRARYIGEKEPTTLTEVSKLRLNHQDDGFFQDHLVQLRKPTLVRDLRKSNQLLWNCFEFFCDKICADPELGDDGVKVTELLSEIVARRLLFIEISVDDEINAYTVFETLNSRRIELTTTDLVKNYLFSELRSLPDLESLQRRWQNLLNTVGQSNFSDFLRYHYATRHRAIRSGRLFKLIRTELKTPEQVFELLGALESRAELFEALGDATHSFWLDNVEAKKHVKELVLFRSKQMTPLLFAAYEKFTPIEFAKVIKLVAVITFRHTTIGGLNTNELETTYHEAAKAILDGVVKSPKQLFKILERVYVQDEKFESDFLQLNLVAKGHGKKLTRYILAKLESESSGREVDADVDSFTIEHILPENPNEEWNDAFPSSIRERNVNRLGNLTLMEYGSNKQSGNAAYPFKLPSYRLSSYSLTSKLAEEAPEEWTPALLEARQGQLAKRAVQIWRSDYA